MPTRASSASPNRSWPMLLVRAAEQIEENGRQHGARQQPECRLDDEVAGIAPCQGKPSQCCSEDEISGHAAMDTKIAHGASATSWPKRSNGLRVRGLLGDGRSRRRRDACPPASRQCAGRDVECKNPLTEVVGLARVGVHQLAQGPLQKQGAGPAAGPAIATLQASQPISSARPVVNARTRRLPPRLFSRTIARGANRVRLRGAPQTPLVSNIQSVPASCRPSFTFCAARLSR